MLQITSAIVGLIVATLEPGAAPTPDERWYLINHLRTIEADAEGQ